MFGRDDASDEDVREAIEARETWDLGQGIDTVDDIVNFLDGETGDHIRTPFSSVFVGDVTRDSVIASLGDSNFVFEDYSRPFAHGVLEDVLGRGRYLLRGSEVPSSGDWDREQQDVVGWRDRVVPRHGLNHFRQRENALLRQSTLDEAFSDYYAEHARQVAEGEDPQNVYQLMDERMLAVAEKLFDENHFLKYWNDQDFGTSEEEKLWTLSQYFADKARNNVMEFDDNYLTADFPKLDAFMAEVYDDIRSENRNQGVYVVYGLEELTRSSNSGESYKIDELRSYFEPEIREWSELGYNAILVGDNYTDKEKASALSDNPIIELDKE